MNSKAVRLATALMIASVWITTAHAAPILPVSYTTQNGETGLYTYYDDSYDGSGSRNASLTALSSGLGDLTDGIIATSNWYVTPDLYVGWRTIDPVITFDFGGIVSIDSVTIHVDDANRYGAVSTPGGIAIDGTSYSIIDPAGSAPLSLTFSGLDFAGSSLDIQIFDGVRTWIMLSEVEFDGKVITRPTTAAQPATIAEPATLALLALGMAGVALGRRRS